MKPDLERAFERLHDFEVVQSGSSFDDLVAAVTLLQESVGIDDGVRRLVLQRLETHPMPASTRGPVMMGLILGLMAAELASGKG